MAGHYFYDPRPFYSLNMSSNLMPLDELFYKYERLPYWMDQRMAPIAYSDYHPGHVKQVMTRAPEVQQFLPYNRPEVAVRDDFYTDVYKHSLHNGLGTYPEIRQPRGQSQDDTWLHTMAPQYANPQTQFPLRGYGAMPMPVLMGYMGYMGNTGAYMSNQNFATQNYNGGEQYGQMEVGSKGFKNQGSNQNSSSKKSSSNNDGYSNKSNNMYNNDASYGSKQVYSNDDIYGTKSNKKQMYNDDDDDNYSSKSKKGTYNDNFNYSTQSKKGTYSDDDNYSSKNKKGTHYSTQSKKGTYSDDDNYSSKSTKGTHNDVNYSTKSKKGTYSDDDNYSSKSKKGIYGNGDGYGTKSSKKMYSNDDDYSTKSSGNTNYGKQISTKQQKRYTNKDSSSDDDEDEYRSGKSGGKWGTKTLLKHGNGNAYSDGKNEMGSKKSGKGDAYNSYIGSDYQSYGANNNMVDYDSGKKPSGQKHGSHSNSGKTSYHNGADTSSDDDDDYAYTKKPSKAGLHRQGVTKVQHSHSNGHGAKGFVSHVPNYGPQPKHTQLYSQSKAVELKVPLCCDNCERKVLACLERVDGVQSVLCDQWQKKVIVYGNVKPDVVLRKVQRVKKASELWQQQQTAQRVPVY